MDIFLLNKVLFKDMVKSYFIYAINIYTHIIDENPSHF